MTQSVTNATYTMGLKIGIGTLKGEATVSSEVISFNYGATWSEYISGASGYSTITDRDKIYVANASGNVLQLNGKQVATTDKIVDGGEYLIPLYTLKNDTTNSYWYIELGQLSDGTKIKWRLVSLDGSSKYNYSTEIPTVGKGSIFLQETYVNSMAYGSSINYSDTDVRDYLKGLETYGDINAYGIKTNPEYISSYEYVCENDYTGSKNMGTVEDDKFWLLSYDQTVTFLPSASERLFLNGEVSVDWWTRQEWYNAMEMVNFVSETGELWSSLNDKKTPQYKSSSGVRAAFQLA